jgi:hypothetical protein
MNTLTFVFTALKQPIGFHVISVAGGADSDGNGIVDQNSEIDAFQRNGLVWTRTQTVALATKGMLFAVTFAMGVGTPWQLAITNQAGALLFSGGNISGLPVDQVSSYLS